jgi:hypothetical protein
MTTVAPTRASERRDLLIARHVLVSFALGATVGAGFDALHTHSGTTMYAREWFAKMAWWVPLLFGTTGVIALGAYPLIEALRRRELAAPLRRGQAATAVVVFAALYACSGFLPVSNLAKLALIGAAAAALWLMLCRSLAAVGIAAIAAAGGVIVEASLVSAGSFWYTTPDVVGVPMWLPALYAAGAFSLGPAGAAMWRRASQTLTSSQRLTSDSIG